MTTDADDALIALLRENARAPVAELARRLGVSRTTAQSRLDRLEKRGVIAGYKVVLAPDYEAARVRAHVMISAVPKLSGRVETALQPLLGVRSLHSISGQFDMIAVVEAASIGALDRLIDDIGALDGVERTLSSIILSTRIDR